MPFSADKMNITTFISGLERRNPGEKEFHQAVKEVAESVIPFINENHQYIEHRILERLTEPDRIITFRVCWEDDEGHVRINRGYRVQMSNAIGPYKGGLRFHPSVSLSVLKFLAFEQVFKNSLTTLPMGAAKGGSDFNPKGKSDREVMRFCQAFMTELTNYIGPDRDVPAGDIGVGAREISYMFAQHKRLTTRFQGVLTGKGLAFGGSLIRAEATGYGTVYFAQEMLKTKNDNLKGKVALVSGSGNVAQYAAEKLIDLGAKVVSLSDSGGAIYDAEGITQEKLEWVINLKTVQRGRISEYVKEFGGEYFEGKTPWHIKADMAFPCATQNELLEDDAETLLSNGCMLIAEGANMPCDLPAIHRFQKAKILYSPGKASNAGGVAVSGLEMTQNSMRLSWDREELDNKLKDIIAKIHKQCVDHGTQDGHIDYVRGANVAGFKKVADAMVAYGFV